jgi:hypothetical protein
MPEENEDNVVNVFKPGDEIERTVTLQFSHDETGEPRFALIGHRSLHHPTIAGEWIKDPLNMMACMELIIEFAKHCAMVGAATMCGHIDIEKKEPDPEQEAAKVLRI